MAGLCFLKHKKKSATFVLRFLASFGSSFLPDPIWLPDAFSCKQHKHFRVWHNSIFRLHYLNSSHFFTITEDTQKKKKDNK